MTAATDAPPTCPTHPTIPLRCPACTGTLGRGKTSLAKAAASRANLRRADAANPKKRPRGEEERS